MLPAPRQKPAQISPIFIADDVVLTVSREKDGKLRLVYAGWDDTKVVQPDGCGQARRRWKGETYPPTGGAVPPPAQTSTPPPAPPHPPCSLPPPPPPTPPSPPASSIPL